MNESLIDWELLTADCVDFARRLIQTPSMPRDEGAIAGLIASEMESLGFDEVWMDEIGNVCGRLIGRRRSRGALVLNSHLDHVDPGDESLWSTPPYSAQIVDGRIVGRGACDIKGPLAVQIYSMAAMIRIDERPHCDVVFTGVVEEETGGTGAYYWAKNLEYPVALVVLAEPSSNHLSLGHRGIFQIWVTFNGRSVHASVPEEGENPNFALAQFLIRLNQHKDLLSTHPYLGETTVSPTIIEVDTASINVTPAWTRVSLDFRTATESEKSLRNFVNQLANGLSFSVTDIRSQELDGPLHDSKQIICGYFTEPDSIVVNKTRSAVAKGMGWTPELITYRFATDGRHFAQFGIPVIGYSPGEESLAHTVKESISIEMMTAGLKGYLQLLREF